LTTGSDDQLGRKIAALFQAQRTSDLPATSIQNQVQDLLGADTALLGPLRDLLQRPAYRQLHEQAGGPASHSLLLAGRDALLQDLALTYQPAVVARLATVIDASLALPPGPPPVAANGSAQTPPPIPGAAPPAWTAATPGFTQVPPPLPASLPSPAPLQVASGPSAVTALLIALVSLLSGAVLLALGWLLFSGRPPSSQVPAGQPPGAPASTAAVPAAAPPPVPPEKGASTTPAAPAPSAPGAWGRSSEYKFGQIPGGDYPNSCAFSVTDANGRTTTDKSQIEYWACRDVGGNPESGYRVVWADGKETTYTFAADGSGTVVGTNGNSYPMRWRNDSHQGSDIVMIDHQDGAISWIPGHIRSAQE
jgi:hypothetical protein